MNVHHGETKNDSREWRRSLVLNLKEYLPSTIYAGSEIDVDLSNYIPHVLCEYLL